MNLSMVRGLTLSLLGCFVVHASLEFILVCLRENFPLSVGILQFASFVSEQKLRQLKI